MNVTFINATVQETIAALDADIEQSRDFNAIEPKIRLIHALKKTGNLVAELRAAHTHLQADYDRLYYNYLRIAGRWNEATAMFGDRFE